VTGAVSAAALRSMLDDRGELALVDVREELIYSQGHLLLARSAPLSRLELKFAELVPRRTTRHRAVRRQRRSCRARGRSSGAQRL
jgi:rhodanese-related sulfurtransferase